MLKQIYTCILFLFCSLLLSCRGAVDPCDVLCDNCSSPKMCIECYEECYDSR